MKARGLSERPSGPLSVRTLLPYGLMIAPAAVAAAFDWRWWIAAILVTPGFVRHIKRSRVSAQARGVVSRDETGEGIVGVILIPGGDTA